MKGVGSHKSSGVFLFYFIVSLLFAGELFIPGQSLFRWDTLLYNWPLLLEARTQILTGHWPFWASSFCNGTPLLANINAGVLYPFRWLCWLLPLKTGYHVFLFVHIWLTFVGMHLFLRRGLRLPFMGAVAGALVFGASGYARSMWDTHNFMALPWIPLGLAALLESRRYLRVALPIVMTSLCWSMLILCGDFQAACIWLPVALMLAAFMPDRAKLIRVLAYAAGLAILITAAQWLPAIVVSSESYRAGGLAYSDAVERSFNPVRLVELFLPHAFGNRDIWFGTALAGTGATKLSPWVASMHVGLLAWLPISFAARRLKRPLVAWSFIVAAGSLLLSCGRFFPLYRLWLALPVIGSFRYPEKYLLWTTLALATLVAAGFPALVTLFRRESLRNPRHAILARWSMIMLGGAVAAMVIAHSLMGSADGASAWMRVIRANTLLTLLLVLVAGLRTWPGRQRMAVLMLLAIDLLLPWYADHPTTGQFNPIAPTAVSQSITSSDSPQGRFFRDRATSQVPLPWNYKMLSPSEKQSVFYRESMFFNVPRIWGLRSADGFSPTESSAMRQFRMEFGAPDDSTETSPEKLALFCKESAVEWLLTTPARMNQLAAQGLQISRYAGWGSADETILARINHVKEVHILDHDGQSRDALEVWRRGPGRMRIDLAAGPAARVVVSESYSSGWRAIDQRGHRLAVVPVNDAFIGVDAPAGTTQVRLAYEPPEWHAAGGISLAGLFLLLVALVAAYPETCSVLLRRPTFVAGVACLVFLLLGSSARGQWACMFDEGFHVTRGLARLLRDDSRLSYFHPPLQNMACGYFANLAVGERIQFPDTPAWRNADLLTYSVEFATRNADIYPDLIQASRIGTLLFSLLLCVMGVYWASKTGGILAAWLAAAGLALNPNMLVNGTISTTDMGVTALAVSGTVFLWKAAQYAPWRNLFWAMFCFTFGAVTKFTGLVWLAAFLFVCVPWVAYREKKPAILFISLVGVATMALFLLILYGPLAQEVRAPGLTWTGARVIAGRYVEGLFAQSSHALEGHKAFFAGSRFESAQWWYLPASVVLKTPAVWVIAGLIALPFGLRQLRRSEVTFPLLPALVFALLLFSMNRLAIGVRHVLPLMALAMIGIAVAVSRIRRTDLRLGACALLVINSLASVALSYPQFASYFPLWAGGADGGYRWLADSNYDWGQELETLEPQWAGLVEANAGQPPSLIYYGFVDPRLIYHLNVGANSYCGYMEQRSIQAGGPEIEAQWKAERFRHMRGVTVASISALELEPRDIDFSQVRSGKVIGRIGRAYFVHRTE